MWTMMGMMVGIVSSLLLAYVGAHHMPWPPSPWWLFWLLVVGALIIGVSTYIGLLVDVLVTRHAEDDDDDVMETP